MSLFTRWLAASAAIAALASGFAQAQFPSKPIRMIVSAPPGSAPDIAARLISDKLDSGLGQRVLIDNRPTANGIVAVQQLREAPPDGHTVLFLHAAAAVVNPFTYKAATYDTERDMDIVATIAVSPMLFVANAKAPAKTLTELIALAKQSPDTIVIGNPTRTTIPHLTAELLAQRSGAKFRQISFSSTPQAIQSLMSGDILYYVDGPAPLMPHVKAGKLTAMAVAADRVMPGLEGIALAKDAVRDLNVVGWFAVVAPKGVPGPVLQRLNAELNKAMMLPDVLARLRDFGTYPQPGTVEDATRFVREQKALFSGVIREAGVQPE
jgi:tripartite-type tricarboxylate transporter receptor subunit TctC